MEKEYRIKIGATAIYMKTKNNWDTAKFLSSMEWRKIFTHWFNETQDDFSEIIVSQYEKTRTHIVPIECLEEYIEESLEEEMQEISKFDFKEFFEQNKKFIFAILICFMIFGLFSIDWKFLKTNTIESNKEINQFQIYSDRLTLLDKKIDFELNKQKNLRLEIRNSVKVVQDIEKEKEAVTMQKIELSE